jgi:hypothetical protein
MQTPLLQTPLPHELLHCPQWAALEARFSQAAPHAVRPCAHVDAQADKEQNNPGLQTVPHAPQFWGSDWTLLHTPPHDRWPAAHEPSLSLLPAGEVVEHALAARRLAASRLANKTHWGAKRVMGFPVGLHSLTQDRACAPATGTAFWR